MTPITTTRLRELKDQVLSEKAAASSSVPPEVEHWLRIIHEEFTDPGLTVEELFARTGWKKNDIICRFRLCTGYSPKTYIRRLRVALGQKLIKTGYGDNLFQVAIAAGFETQSAFTKAFANCTGMTPSAYRGGRKFTRFFKGFFKLS